MRDRNNLPLNIKKTLLISDLYKRADRFDEPLFVCFGPQKLPHVKDLRADDLEFLVNRDGRPEMVILDGSYLTMLTLTKKLSIVKVLKIPDLAQYIKKDPKKGGGWDTILRRSSYDLARIEDGHTFPYPSLVR